MNKVKRLSIIITMASLLTVFVILGIVLNGIYNSYKNGQLKVFIKTNVVSIEGMSDIKNVKSGGSPAIVNTRIIGFPAYVYDVSNGFCSAEIYNIGILSTIRLNGDEVPLNCFSLNEDEISYLDGSNTYSYVELLNKELFEYRNIPQYIISTQEKLLHKTLSLLFFQLITNVVLVFCILFTKTQKRLNLLFCLVVCVNLISLVGVALSIFCLG